MYLQHDSFATAFKRLIDHHNIAHFGKKEQKAWDTYIAENADQIREKLGDNLNAEIAQYYADNGL
jgi:hypothetical protein